MPLKKSFNVLSEDNWLSLAQVEIFKKKVAQHFPDVELNLSIDKELGITDFFIGEANNSINNYSVVIEGGLLNDVVVFNPTITDKINHSKNIKMGSSKTGQTLMAVKFLEKALPNLNNQPINFDFEFIDGNILERFDQLDTGKYDAIILSVADLNILLSFQLSQHIIKHVLADKKIMVLPLFDCPPAAGQSAIIVSTSGSNLDAIEILNKLKNEQYDAAFHQELIAEEKYKKNDSMAFGSFHITTGKTNFFYAAGIDKSGKEYSVWDYKMDLDTNKKIFSSADYMKDFFIYDYIDEIQLNTDCEAIFIASHKAIHSTKIKKEIDGKRVWAAGTKSWFQLAKQGIWVEGCSDGIGLEWLLPIFESQLVDLTKEKINIITNKASVEEWKAESWNGVASYRLLPNFLQPIADEVALSDILFWTSFLQYKIYKNFVKAGAQHVCPAGKTADLLIREGLSPIIFPTIKAFNDWMVERFDK